MEFKDQTTTGTATLVDTAAVIPEVVEELTDDEEQDRHRLERKIEWGIEQVERTFYEMGKALAELRDRRLYRSTHKNFGSYCKERFDCIKRRQAEYLILASEVVDDLKNAHNCAQFPLPTSESQVRSMKDLTPRQRREVWQTGVAESGGVVPTAKTIKGIVERLKEKHHQPATDFYNVGDVFSLTGLSGHERKYNGCWTIATSVNNFTVEVEVHDAVLSVKPDNLNRIDSPDVRRQLPSILKRIKRLRQCDLDRGAYPILESLGRQTYLTEFEADLLAFMEQRYGIELTTPP